MNTHDQYKIGPDGKGSYRYMIHGILSAEKYHNAESARADARRLQVAVWPVPSQPRIRPATDDELW